MESFARHHGAAVLNALRSAQQLNTPIMGKPSRYNADRTEKFCSKCGILKPVADFQKTWAYSHDRAKKYHMLRAECRACNAARLREWEKIRPHRERHPSAEYARAWRARNLEHYRNYQRIYHRSYDMARRKRLKLEQLENQPVMESFARHHGAAVLNAVRSAQQL
jgi:hypothetical protein